MSIKTVHSTKGIDHVAKDLRGQLGNFEATMVLYFASSMHDPDRLSSDMHAVFQGASVFGCSTAGEIISGQMLKNSVVAMALDNETVADAAIEVVENIITENRIPLAFQKFEEHHKTPMASLDIERFVGIILADGLTAAEEKLMDKIGDLTDVTFIGGSAGDDLAFKKTHVFADGKAYSNAAVVALLQVPNGFDVIKTQSFRVLDKTLTATEVDEASRKVISFNNVPATEAYELALGAKPGEAADYFMTNPVGLMVGDEPYVRSPQQTQGSGMVFYCNIKEGMELKVLESTDIVNDTKQAVEEKLKALGDVEGIINFHCILRTLELTQKDRCKAYGAIFDNIPTIGFSTYGEAYLGHINQTSTMLVFKK